MTCLEFNFDSQMVGFCTSVLTDAGAENWFVTLVYDNIGSPIRFVPNASSLK